MSWRFGLAELLEQLVDPEIELRRRAPKRPTLVAKLLKQPERVELTIVLGGTVLRGGKIPEMS